MEKKDKQKMLNKLTLGDFPPLDGDRYRICVEVSRDHWGQIVARRGTWPDAAGTAR